MTFSYADTLLVPWVYGSLYFVASLGGCFLFSKLILPLFHSPSNEDRWISQC